MQASKLDDRWMSEMSELNSDSPNLIRQDDWSKKTEVRRRLDILLKNKNVRGVKEIIEHILLPALLEKENRKEMLAAILNDEKQRGKILKEFQSIDIIKMILGKKKVEPREKLEELGTKLPFIRSNSPKLAQVISQVYGKKEIDLLVLRIYNIFSKVAPIQIFEHFKEHNQEYIQRFGTIEDKGVAVLLKNIMIRFLLLYSKRKKESRIIDAFIQELSLWREPVEDISKYATRARYYLDLLKSLNDPLLDLKLGDERIKQLLHYEEELKLFEQIRTMVEKGEYEATWAHFIQFYRRVKYISDKVKDEYGDPNDAKALIEAKKKFHESPEDWLRVLHDMINHLKNNSAIIAAARAGLFEMCKKNKEGIDKSILDYVGRAKIRIEKEISSQRIKKPSRSLAFVRKVTIRMEKDLRRKLARKQNAYDGANKLVENKWEELGIIGSKLIKIDFERDKVFFDAIDKRRELLSNKESNFMAKLNVDDPLAADHLKKGIVSFAAYESDLSFRADQRKRVVRQKMYNEIPSLLFAFSQKCYDIDQELDKIFSIFSSFEVKRISMN